LSIEPLKPPETLSFEEVNSPEFLEDLLAKGTRGPRAFTRLVRATHDRFLGFIQRQLSSQDECREVLQEVYLAVYKGLPGFAGKSKLTTWMYSLAHHKICDRFSERDRKHVELTEAREAGLSTETAESDKWDAISAWDASPERVMARNAMEKLIGKAIEALPVNARQVYQLRDVEGLSGDEAAAVLGITSENVRVQLHRARRQIVDWVQEKMAKAQVSK
jgi:RNA polymerase sigma-70 factor, ECF subfamily